MSGRASRAKGSRGELELSKIIAERTGLDIRRTPNSGGLYLQGSTGMPAVLAGDLMGFTGYHVEAKRQETIKIHEWTRQTDLDCPEGSQPLLAYRRSREPWRVVITLDHFLDLVQCNLEVNNED